MKIVLPYNTHFGEYNSDIIVGGIEKFCHQIVDNFPNVEIIPVNIPNSSQVVEDATVYWGNRITSGIIDSMPKLEWIHFGSDKFPNWDSVVEYLMKD